MPCTYEETPQERAEAAAKSKARRDREINRVTNLLCSVAKVMERGDLHSFEDVAVAFSAIPGFDRWCIEHKRRDAGKK